MDIHSIDFNTAIQFISTNKYALMILIGFGVGLIARILMPGPDPMGILMTSVLGIAGSFVGAFGAGYVGVNMAGPVAHHGLSVVGALALLAIFKFVRNV